VVLNLLATKSVMATHLRAADIKIERACGSGYTFKITIIEYLNSESTTNFRAYATLAFCDGPSVRVPETASALRPDLVYF
jgi:hypothetical protein